MHDQGLDTDSPIVQVDNMVFQGRYIEAIGTNLFFGSQEDSTPESFVSRSTKVLRCHRVVLDPKHQSVASKEVLIESSTK